MFECVRCGNQNEHGAAQCAQCTWPFSKDAWSSTGFKIKRITIDTGCVNAKKANDELNTLEHWRSMGRIEIERADVLFKELKGANRLAKAQEITQHPNLFTIGTSVIGGDHVIAGPDLSKYIGGVLFPTTSDLTTNQENDVRHLAQHIRVGGDIFVTLNTKDFLKHGKHEKLAHCGIWVFTPEGVIQLLKRLYSW